MRKILLATAAIMALTGIANADVIAERKELMKSMGKSIGAIAPIMKGEKDFDATTVMAALEALKADADKFDPVALFPEGTDKGGETEALPTIWEQNDEFKADAAKFREDTAAAVAANPQNIDELRPVFQQVASNCGACHQTFREKQQ